MCFSVFYFPRENSCSKLSEESGEGQDQGRGYLKQYRRDGAFGELQRQRSRATCGVTSLFMGLCKVPRGSGLCWGDGSQPFPRGYMPSHKWCLDLISGRFGKKKKNILFVATRKSQRGAPRPRLAPWLHRVALLGSILRGERHGGGGAARAIASPIPSAGSAPPTAAPL